MTIRAIPTDLQDLLERSFADNTLRSWLTALAVALGVALVLWLVKRVVEFRLAKLAERTATDLDDLVVDLIRRTTTLSLVAIGVFVAHHGLTLSLDAEAYVVRGAKIAIWLQFGLWGVVLVRYSITRLVKGKAKDDPSRTMGASILGFLGSVFVWSIVLLLCLAAMGQEIGPLLASLGVGGIAVALALQNILGDLFASITILLDKPFVVGDSIILGDFQGTVERIGVKTTRLRSVSGEEIVIGNNDLVSSRVRNFKRMRERRQIFILGITYETPLAEVARIPDMLRQIVAGIPEARLDRAHFKGFGPSSLDFEVVYYALNPDMGFLMDVQQRINLEILERFEKAGIQFAYPTQMVHTYAHPGEAPPEKPLQKQLGKPPERPPERPADQKELSRG